MNTLERAWTLTVIVCLLLVGGFIVVQFSLVSVPWTEDHAEVTIVGDDGTTKATVDAEVADTWVQRYIGLSEHETLEDDEGMLFVHANEDERTYVMRNMDFDIDIIFVGSDGTITTIYHARAPDAGEDGSELRYSGSAQWVLEVPRGTVNESEIAVGDELEIEYR